MFCLSAAVAGTVVDNEGLSLGVITERAGSGIAFTYRCARHTLTLQLREPCRLVYAMSGLATMELIKSGFSVDRPDKTELQLSEGE